jgi:hypothetical protein
VQPCDAAPPQITFTVTFAPPGGEDASVVQVLVGYKSSVLNLPAGSAANTRIGNLPRNSQFTVDNLGYAVEVTVDSGLSPTLPPGTLFTVDLDSYVESAPPTPADVSCILESCADADGDPLAGCTCTITGP